MRVWLEDLKYHLAMAGRAVGLGLMAVAWSSALGSEAQQNADVRTLAQVAALSVAIFVTQWLTSLPPSRTLVELLRPLERDIVAVAREMRVDAERLVLLAAGRIRDGANVPRDRRAWLRALSSLAQADEA